MSFPMKSRKWMPSTLAMFSALTLALACSSAPAAAQGKPEGKRWDVKFQAGSAQLGEDQPVTVTLARDVIHLQSGNEYVQVIRVSDVKQITYDTGRGRYLSRALAMAPMDAETSTGILVSTAVTLPLAIATLPLKGKRCFVTIEWAEGRRHRGVMFRMMRIPARQFIKELEKFTGLTARNLDHERDEFKKKQQEEARVRKSQGEAQSASPPEN